jgi:hypothetical protein
MGPICRRCGRHIVRGTKTYCSPCEVVRLRQLAEIYATPPTAPAYHLLENAPAPDLPARQPGQSEQDYQRSLGHFTAAWSGKRARPHRSLFHNRLPEHQARGVAA